VEVEGEGEGEGEEGKGEGEGKFFFKKNKNKNKNERLFLNFSPHRPRDYRVPVVGTLPFFLGSNFSMRIMCNF
jgi:hypothetical protein